MSRVVHIEQVWFEFIERRRKHKKAGCFIPRIGVEFEEPGEVSGEFTKNSVRTLRAFAAQRTGEGMYGRR